MKKDLFEKLRNIMDEYVKIRNSKGYFSKGNYQEEFCSELLLIYNKGKENKIKNITIKGSENELIEFITIGEKLLMEVK